MSRPRGDSGSTLVVALMVLSLALGLSLMITEIAIDRDRESGVDRQRSTAVAAAEAGVDAAYTAIQNSGVALPCAWPATGTATVRTHPDTAEISAAIEYFDADGQPVPCTSLSSVVPASAVIESRGTTRTIPGGTDRGDRRMQAYVNLHPVYGNGFNRAIFADGNIELRNNHRIRGNEGADADLYSNADVICPSGSNQHVEGSIYAQGRISFVGQCSADGKAWARGDVSLLHNQSRVGSVTSSIGNVVMGGPATASSGTVHAGGTIDWPAGCATSGRCYAGLPSQDPPQQPFPILRGDAATLAQWPGYQVIEDNSCSGLVSRITGTYGRTGTPTIVKTSCAVNFVSIGNVALGNDLAIFANGGFSTQNLGRIGSTDGTQRRLYWIVPYESAPSRPCASPGITIRNNFSITDDVDMMLYTPCNITVDNNSDHFGQIYSGSTATIDNRFDMDYRPLPVYGIDPASLPTLSYEIDIVYKREVKQ